MIAEDIAGAVDNQRGFGPSLPSSSRKATQMPLYRRKPTIVDAEQFIDPANPPRGVERHYMHGKYPVEFVRTMQGREVPVSVGEWIIKEASGEGYYPIADEEFRRIYEPT